MSDHIQEFQAHIEAAGLRPDHIHADGYIHRCPVEGKPRAKDGAYILHLDPPCSGWFENHRTGETGTWTATAKERMSQADRDRLRQRIEAARQEARRQRAADHQAAADRARTLYDRARPASQDHAYLIKKGIRPLPGLRQAGKLLVVPVMNEAGKIISLQYISPDGQKRFLKGGQTAGGLFAIKGDDTGPLAICEGMATSASIHQATGWTVLVAFNAGNLGRVAEIARKKYPTRKIIVCGDNDTKTQGNPGLTAAQDASRAVSGLLAIPDMDGKPCDWNDYAQANGLEATREALEQAREPSPEQAPDEWPDLIPYGDHDAPAISCDVLPGWAGQFAAATADSIQVPSALAVCSVLGALATTAAGAIRHIEIRPGYREPLNLYLVSIRKHITL